MRKIIILLLVVGMLLSTAPFSMGREEASEMLLSHVDESSLPVPDDNFLHGDKLDFVSGEMIIKFKESVDVTLSVSPDGILNTGLPSIDLLNKKNVVFSAEQVFENNPVSLLSNIFKFTLPEDADILSVVEEYCKDSCVVYAEPNYLYHTCVVPNDSDFNQQWALHNTGQTGGTPDADIDAPEAWDIGTGNPNVIIAVSDSGVDYNHNDLADNIWINDNEIPGNGIDDDGNGYIDDIRGWDFRHDNNNPMDEHGHGTHCAGIAAAVTDNNIGIAGACWNCKIMSLQVADENWGGATNAICASSIVYAADNGADVVSMSWGSYSRSQLLIDAVNYAHAHDVALVAAAGNGDINMQFYPAAYPHVIAVGATDDNDEKASFSNHGFWVDVSAPGVDIISTVLNNSYEEKSGTSMATPHVAGLAALLLSRYNCEYPAGMVETLIKNTADPVSSVEYIGRGRINAYEALTREPAIAILDSFLDWNDIKGIIEITGSAGGDYFESYTVEYGKGENPTTWNVLEQSTIPKENGGVLSTWQTEQVEDGLYTIRLRVTSAYEYSDLIRIILNNEQNIIHVDDDNINGPWDGTSEHPFKIIQDGILYAGLFDEVYVHNGIYHEQPVIYKSINLTGEDKTNTIIDGDEKMWSVLTVIGTSEVTITGFTVKESYQSGSGLNAGIEIDYSNDITVVGCKLESDLTGISLYESQYNTIKQNVFKENTQGLYIKRSSHNTISGNSIHNNIYGIYIAYWSHNNVVSNNVLCDQMCEIVLFAYASNNAIYHNNLLVHNCGYMDWRKCNADVADTCTGNMWYNEKLKEGNYWDDYNGFDEDGDGIGDTPYSIDGGNKDEYPFMTAINKSSDPPNKPSKPSGKTTGIIPNKRYTYTTITTDPNVEFIRYYFDWGDGSTEWTKFYQPDIIIEVEHEWEKLFPTINIKVKAKDVYGYESEWSEPLPFMPRNKILSNTLFMKLQERFPNAFPILRQLLGL